MLKNLDAPGRERMLLAVAVLLVALALAVASTSRRISVNDASRLATVECLVDYHTLAIDRSAFLEAAGCDKLYIRGHYYSDKSPVPALLLALLYQLWQWWTGLTAAEHVESFAYGMSLVSSGLAYVAAVWCIFRLTRDLRLTWPNRLALTASFAVSTMTLAFARQVNNHIQLLAVSAALFLGLVRLAADGPASSRSRYRLLVLGCLAGLGYAIDLGTGPVLLVCTLALVVYRCRSLGAAGCFLLAAAPWLILHHVVNYAVGGTFQPANAVPEYFRLPEGILFRPEDLTGSWQHPSVGHFLVYAVGFLVGPRGFLGHNLPLFLAVPGLVVLLWRRLPERPELLLAAVWSGGTWLTYAMLSTNYSGLTVSVRWLVPLLAPGYLVLALLLRQFPRCRGSFLVLSAWGVVLGCEMWSRGTWHKSYVPLYWPIQAGALLSWLGYEIGYRLVVRARRTRAAEGILAQPPASTDTRRAAA